VDYDRVLIEQSIAKQYGVLPSAQGDLRYSDWAKMVSGLMDDTPLGRVVGTRMEQDREILKHYTPEQRRIRSEWTQFCAQKRAQQPIRVLLYGRRETLLLDSISCLLPFQFDEIV